MTELEQLRKLLAEATPGPWRTVGDKSPNMTGVHAGPSTRGDSYLLFTLINDPNDSGPMGEGGLLPETVAQWKADAALICAAVNALPGLIARVEEMESLLNHLLTTDQTRTRGELQILDIAYTAFMRAKGKNDEDGGPTDWITDTRPLIAKELNDLAARAALRKEP